MLIILITIIATVNDGRRNKTIYKLLGCIPFKRAHGAVMREYMSASHITNPKGRATATLNRILRKVTLNLDVLTKKDTRKITG